MKKHKICILSSVHYYNDNRVYYKELLSLKEAGYEITYITTKVTGEIDESINIIELGHQKTLLTRLCSIFKAFLISRKLDVECVHFHDPELIICGILLKLFTRKKVIYDVHEDYPSQMLTKFYVPERIRPFLKRMTLCLEWISGKLFDAIIVADTEVFKHFPKDKTIILYNFPSLKLLSETEKQLSKTEKIFDIIFPGSMALFTADLILKIIKKAKDTGRELKCLLISPFHFNGGIEWVKQKAAELGITENLTLMSRIPPYEVPLYLKSTRIGLIPLPDTPKMRANIPTKMFEYMYFGLPVITGNLPPCASFMNRNEFGYLVAVNSVEDYTSRILYLLENQAKLEGLGKKGRELILDEYNWEKESTKLENLYNKLLN